MMHWICLLQTTGSILLVYLLSIDYLSLLRACLRETGKVTVELVAC